MPILALRRTPDLKQGSRVDAGTQPKHELHRRWRVERYADDVRVTIAAEEVGLVIPVLRVAHRREVYD